MVNAISSEDKIILFLIGTKKDLEAERVVQTDEIRQFQKKAGIHFFMETSAKSGDGVEDAFVSAAKMLYCDPRFSRTKPKPKPSQPTSNVPLISS